MLKLGILIYPYLKDGHDVCKKNKVKEVMNEHQRVVIASGTQTQRQVFHVVSAHVFGCIDHTETDLLASASFNVSPNQFTEVLRQT